MKMSEKNYYDILGVSENASEQEIQRAYRNLAKKYHPDKLKGDKVSEERFKEISEAYAVLKDPKKRKKYDNMRRFGGGFAGNHQNVDFDDFSSIFQGGFRGQRSAGFGNIGDIFSELFGGRPGHTPQSQRGQDIHAELTIPFDVAISGGKQLIDINGQRISVHIPAGSDENKKIRLRGQGKPGYAGGAAGDLIVTLHIAPHPLFKRKGADIYSSAQINMVQAVLGSRVRVQTYDKGMVDLKIPPGTQPGKLFKLKGLGINDGHRRGDHYVEVDVVIPKNLNSKAKEALKRFAELSGMMY